MKNKTNVPQIRFAGFTDAWEQRKFGDLADYKKGPFGSALKKDIFVPRDETTVKVYEQQNAINKDWTLERYFITKEYARKLSGFKVLGGDIIVSCAGTIGEIYEIPMDAEPGVINQALMKIKVNELVIDRKMFMILFSNMIDDFTRVHSNGSAIKNIPPFSDLKPMEVLVPKMEEQRKISKYITELDHLITLHQRECDLLDGFKQTCLQKMFPKKGCNVPEIRLAGFTGAWEKHKVSELFKVTRGYVLSATLTEPTITDETPYPVYSSQTKDKGLMGYYKDYLYEDAITWTTDGANAGTVNYRSGKFYCTNVCGVLLSNEIKANQMIAEALNNVAKGYVSYVGNPKLMNNVMADIEIKIPTQSEEREQLSQLFAKFDHLITLHRHELEELQNIKKTMLEKMFV